MGKTLYYYEVSVSKNGGSDGGLRGLWRKGDKVHWVRKGLPKDSYVEAMNDAIANGERPYRIKSERIDNEKVA